MFPTARAPSHVVGIGASAGGLDALESLLRALPADTGMAFVVVLHPAPSADGPGTEVLARHTAMPVRRVEHGLAPAPDTVHLMPTTPPGQVVRLANGRLCLEASDPDPADSPVDVFLESLATALAERAVAIVLSGAGADGARGVVSISEAGGLVLAESPESARFDGMPRAAVKTGRCHHVVSTSGMRSTSDALPPDANFRDLRARADGPLGRRAWRADERRIGPDGARWWTRGGAAG